MVMVRPDTEKEAALMFCAKVISEELALRRSSSSTRE